MSDFATEITQISNTMESYLSSASNNPAPETSNDNDDQDIIYEGRGNSNILFLPNFLNFSQARKEVKRNQGIQRSQEACKFECKVSQEAGKEEIK